MKDNIKHVIHEALSLLVVAGDDINTDDRGHIRMTMRIIAHILSTSNINRNSIPLVVTASARYAASYGEYVDHDGRYYVGYGVNDKDDSLFRVMAVDSIVQVTAKEPGYYNIYACETRLIKADAGKSSSDIMRDSLKITDYDNDMLTCMKRLTHCSNHRWLSYAEYMTAVNRYKHELEAIATGGDQS